MKFSAQKIVALSLFTALIGGVIPASAFTRLVRGSEGMGKASVNELASEDVAILPGNPFHFVIGLGSNIKGFFISNKLDEANFKLEVAGRRAGEVRKLLDWASDNADLLSLSLTQYERSLLEFEAKLRVVEKSDLGDDADAIINEMVSRILTQLRFVDDIRASFVESAEAATLTSIDESLAASLRFIASHLDESSSFGGRIANLVTENTDAATAVRVVGVLAKLIREVAGVTEMEEFVSAIATARDMLIADLANAIRQESGVSAMKMAPSIAAFAAPAPVEQIGPTVSEIVDQLADETLKAELAALLQ